MSNLSSNQFNKTPFKSMAMGVRKITGKNKDKKLKRDPNQRIPNPSKGIGIEYANNNG
jgi:hypothetical protein